MTLTDLVLLNFISNHLCVEVCNVQQRTNLPEFSIPNFCPSSGKFVMSFDRTYCISASDTHLLSLLRVRVPFLLIGLPGWQCVEPFCPSRGNKFAQASSMYMWLAAKLCLPQALQVLPLSLLFPMFVFQSCGHWKLKMGGAEIAYAEQQWRKW